MNKNIIILYLVLLGLCGVYNHDHHEIDEPPHFKYSAAANSRADINKDDSDDHGHSHGGHGNSHGEHGHSHGERGHGHGHGHGHSHGEHGHSHGGHGHSHGGHGHAHGGHNHRGHGHAHSGHDHSNENHGHAHSGHDHSNENHGHSHNEKPTETKKNDFIDYTNVQENEDTTSSMFDISIKALFATVIISAAPIVILFFIPIDNTPQHEKYLKVLLSFASGGLLGDAFLHLIPHAIDPHDHGSDHSHSHSHVEALAHDHSKNIRVGMWVLAGVLAFLTIEKLVRIIRTEAGHEHSHGQASTVTATTTSENKTDVSAKKKDLKKKVSPNASSDGRMLVAGYLNLIADFTHNLTDGLAIGASFLVANNIGIVTTIIIFFHEIPHEIGDFAILVQSGCSRKRAMLLQMTTAFGALLGTVISLVYGGVSGEKTSWILPFTAGGFIYIATVSVIPELLKNSTMKQSIKEIVALLMGVLLMAVVAFYE